MAEITNLRPQSHQELPGSIETFLEKAHYRILFAFSVIVLYCGVFSFSSGYFCAVTSLFELNLDAILALRYKNVAIAHNYILMVTFHG